MGYPGAPVLVAPRGSPTYFSRGAASLSAALHPGLRKPAASLARGLRKSLPRPTTSAWQLRIPATAASSKCADGPLGWRRLAGPWRPQPLGCCVPAGECNPRARGTPAFTPWVPVQLGGFPSSHHSHFTAKLSPFPSCGRQNAHTRPKGCGKRTFRRRCGAAEARDASICRWCCGPRHLSQSCLGAPGS